MIMPVNLTALPKAVRERMHEIWSDENAMEMVKAKIRQEQIAKFYHDHPPKWKEGFGELTMAVDPYWRGYFQMLHETGEVWDEKDFQKWVAKNMPELRVKAVSPKIQVGYRRGARGKTVKRYTSK
jgi:hypothetical protein